MLLRVWIILLFGAFLGLVYCWCMHATPQRGLMRVLERICVGVILCYLCQLVLKPFGIQIAQSPLAALSAGYLGLPGVALGAFVAGMP